MGEQVGGGQRPRRPEVAARRVLAEAGGRRGAGLAQLPSPEPAGTSIISLIVSSSFPSQQGSCHRTVGLRVSRGGISLSLSGAHKGPTTATTRVTGEDRHPPEGANAAHGFG